MKRLILAFIVAFVVAFALVTLRAEEASQSAAPAASVKALLEQLKMDSIAARDPEEPGRYIAARRPGFAAARDQRALPVRPRSID
jgi:hypothetical protein